MPLFYQILVYLAAIFETQELFPVLRTTYESLLIVSFLVLFFFKEVFFFLIRLSKRYVQSFLFFLPAIEPNVDCFPLTAPVLRMVNV